MTNKYDFLYRIQKSTICFFLSFIFFVFFFFFLFSSSFSSQIRLSDTNAPSALRPIDSTSTQQARFQLGSGVMELKPFTN